VSLFTLESVDVSRGGRKVLDGFSAELDGEAIGLLGPSGSGKSTLLRLLNRLADPDRGRVLFRGDDVREQDVLELRRRAVLVPQLPALRAGSVAENVELGPRLAGRAADVPRALEQAGLGASFAERPADELSVGEQQRVMLARAMALEPEVLLLDEPTSALDEAARAAVERTLQDLRGQVAIVLVTHDPAQAERLTDRTVRLG
jgi:putative ABC transport system ATP-binding protein